MEITTRILEGQAILDLSGKVTLGDGDELLRTTVRQVIDQGHRKIALNLERVLYVDSAGLGELVRAYMTVTGKGGTLELQNVPKRVAELLRITKLTDWMK